VEILLTEQFNHFCNVLTITCFGVIGP